MKSAPLAVIALTNILSALPVIATENDRLTREERHRVGHVYAKVIDDPEVQDARGAYEAATKHYHHVLRQEMIQYDPKVKPALGKINTDPTLLVEAIWEKRNKDVLKNLHLPVGRLNTEERKQWNHAMNKLRQKEITKAFARKLERNYQQQAKLRSQQEELMANFKREARDQLLTLDRGLKPILSKLEGGDPITVEPSTDPEEVKVLEQEAELVPAMPMPMPPTPDEGS